MAFALPQPTQNASLGLSDVQLEVDRIIEENNSLYVGDEAGFDAHAGADAPDLETLVRQAEVHDSQFECVRIMERKRKALMPRIEINEEDIAVVKHQCTEVACLLGRVVSRVFGLASGGFMRLALAYESWEASTRERVLHRRERRMRREAGRAAPENLPMYSGPVVPSMSTIPVMGPAYVPVTEPVAEAITTTEHTTTKAVPATNVGKKQGLLRDVGYALTIVVRDIFNLAKPIDK
jgi:hypothetical protein